MTAGELPPWLPGEGELGGGGAGVTEETRFGETVAVSADGGTALVGGGHDAGNTGAAWVFIRSGSTWVQQGEKLVGSLLLGLYNADGKLDHVGFTSGFAALDRKALTKKLEGLRGGPGFTSDAPGGPSRWSTEHSAEWVPLKPKLIAEVRYDHVTGDRFRRGTKFLRWRPDKKAAQCTFDQLGHEASPGLIVQTIAAAKPSRRKVAK